MPDLSQTRQSLLLRLKQHESDAWAEFLAVYEQAIYRYFRSKGLQDADARDATQDVLTAIHKQIGSWQCDRSKGSLRAWLFRVARNIAADAMSARRRTAASGDSGVMALLNNRSQSDNAEAAAFQLEYRRSLFQWAIEQVRPEVREPTWRSFWLTAIEGQPPECVARELKLSIGTVYTAKCRVVARIRAKIAEVDQPATELPDDASRSAAVGRLTADFKSTKPIDSRG
jgi:RNA polymerase sigma factor (sigma-70 family)